MVVVGGTVVAAIVVRAGGGQFARLRMGRSALPRKADAPSGVAVTLARGGLGGRECQRPFHGDKCLERLGWRLAGYGRPVEGELNPGQRPRNLLAGGVETTTGRHHPGVSGSHENPCGMQVVPGHGQSSPGLLQVRRGISGGHLAELYLVDFGLLRLKIGALLSGLTGVLGDAQLAERLAEQVDLLAYPPDKGDVPSLLSLGLVPGGDS